MVSKVAASTVMIPMTASQYADLGDFFVHYPKRATRSKKFEPVSNKFDRHDPEINSVKRWHYVNAAQRKRF